MNAESSRRLSPRMLLFALSLALVVGVVAAQIPPADEAFEAGDYDRALALYDETLAGNPGDVHALVRSGMLLSWRKKYDEALRRYDRALAADPRNETAGLERAKVLSWDRKYDQASEAFQSLLARDPGNREARLGLARSLSWGGDQSEARLEYQKLIDKDPRDVEALVGRAQTYAWSGDLVRARDEYDRALQIEPGRREALLGEAYIDLWSRDFGSAERKARDLARRFPEDADVKTLQDETSKARTPWIITWYDRIDDTDDNELDIYKIEGGWGLPAGMDLVLGAARWDMTGPADPDIDGTNTIEDASVDSYYALLHIPTWPGQRVSFRLGADRRENSIGKKDTETIGGITYSWGQSRRVQGSVSANRDSFRYSPAILDAGNPASDKPITIDAAVASLSGRMGDRWSADVEAGYWDLSDGNNRKSFQGGFRYRWPVTWTTLETGYALRYFDYDKNLGHGYFDPSSFVAHLAQVRAFGKFGSSKLYYDAIVEGGVQSFDVAERTDPATGALLERAERVSSDRVLGGAALLGFPLPGNFTIELYGNKTDYAQQSASGFQSRQLGVRLRWGGVR